MEKDNLKHWFVFLRKFIIAYLKHSKGNRQLLLKFLGLKNNHLEFILYSESIKDKNLKRLLSIVDTVLLLQKYSIKIDKVKSFKELKFTDKEIDVISRIKENL